MYKMNINKCLGAFTFQYVSLAITMSRTPTEIYEIDNRVN